MRLAVRNLIRHRSKSILSGVIGMLTVLLLVIYAGNIGSTNYQLESLPEVMPISAKITSLNGALDAGLVIREKTVDGIACSAEVKDAVFTVQLKAGFADSVSQGTAGTLPYMASGVNAIAGVPGLREEDIRFAEGSTADFFASDRAECIMDAWTMEQNGYAPGDEVLLNLYYYRYSREWYSVFLEPLTVMRCRIVGTMDIQEFTGNSAQPDVLLPFEFVRRVFHEKELEFTADSASFTVRDPFRLNECKEDMHEIGLLPVAKNAEYRIDGNALTMKDDTFINAAENLRETLMILTGMLPFVVVIVIFVGYLCSYLLIQGRKAEYATMRSVGMGWGYCFFVMLLENLLIDMTACAAVSLAALLSGSVSGRILLMADAVFLFSFLAGSSMALWSFRSLSVMEVLSAGE